MKTRILLFLMLFLIAIPLQGVSASPALPPGVVHNGPGLWTVYPHNSSPDDPNRIQVVVNLAKPGDTVRLAAGTFDFSEFENVLIAKDLTLEGEWDSRRQVPVTTILHGFAPVLIGRKTPVVKPALEMVNGHAVYHLTKDIWGKLNFPFTYPEENNYNIFDDWVPVHVNVRQIAFERPYLASVYAGAMNGGVIERVRIHSTWPVNLDYEGSATGAMGIGWYNPSILSKVVAEWGRPYNPDLYFNTDLIRGSLVVQNSFIDGDAVGLAEGTTDEAGDLVAVKFADYPTPPDGDYAKYVLQDVAFARDETGYPISDSIQVYWVKKGYSALSDGSQVWVNRGIWAGVYSLFAQSNLKVRNNTIQNCSIGMFLLENGFTGVPFTADVGNNQIIPAIGADWGSGLVDLGWDHFLQATGETLHANPGTFITFHDNTIRVRNPDLAFWGMAVNIAMYGKAVVESNRFDLASGSGVAMSWPSQSTVVSDNRISGSGDYAMWTDFGSNGNLLAGNDLRGFTPSGEGDTDVGAPPAQVLLLSDNNKVIGGPGPSDQTVVDYGSNNTVIGMVHQIGTLQAMAGDSVAARSYSISQGKGHRSSFHIFR